MGDSHGNEDGVLALRAGLPLTPPDSDDGNRSYSSRSPSPTPHKVLHDQELPQPPRRSEAAVLGVDKNTPDSHVPRDPRLIRLTGVHPFNAEAPLSDLFNEGFLTSPELSYVRNHGAVPQVHDANVLDWEFSVEGMVENPFRMTLRDMLSEFEQVTYPATLVCAGNRRKEQNVVRKTKGFSWGAAGVSTALWTGVPMHKVIKKARPRRNARYVCMEGADKLPKGYYGTSVKMNWVMDPNRGIMLAHKMNGEPLTPDHGKPLRAIIPGQIGGRSVKWITKIILTTESSDNWYHIYDNRVLPTTVSPEQSASNPSWWMDERYAIYDLNCNSAIVYPAHDERLGLESALNEYQVKGYAYSGGGRRITRVEVSLGKGQNWRLASIDYPEDRYRQVPEGTKMFGERLDTGWRETCFCWCFWAVHVPVDELKHAEGIVVRSMDESMQIQPRDMYWSVLGMMNNPWFRVSIQLEDDYLRFEHPTLPALKPGGWMERIKKAGGNLTNGYWGERLGDGEVTSSTKLPQEIQMTRVGVDESISINELKKHENAEEPWFVVNGHVYDGAPFMKEHPGGAQSIISAAGMDSTDEFMAIHSETAKGMMPSYHIGQLDEASRKALSQGVMEEDTSNKSREVFLNGRLWRKAQLYSKTAVSWDTRVFRFKLDCDKQKLGLPTGKHLMMRLRDAKTQEPIIRAYTPISEPSEEGYMDVLVKVYFDSKERRGGRMSQAMDNMPIGQFMDFKGPIGKFEYIGHGRCDVNGKERVVRTFYMICGGSGITPIYQVFRAVMQEKDDTTKCVILNSNRLFEDILCKKELDAYAAGNDHKSQVFRTLTEPADDWTGLRGRIAAPLLERLCTREEGKSMALICGPEPLEKSVHKALKEQGWPDDDILVF